MSAEPELDLSLIENAILEVLTNGSIPTKEINRWNWLTACWADVGRKLDMAIGSSDEKPQVTRLITCLMLWECISRLASPRPAAPNLAKEVERRLAAVQPGAEPIADAPQPQPAVFPVSFVRKTGSPVSFTAKRNHSKNPTYSELLSRMTPEKQAEFRRKRVELQQRRRARLKAAKLSLVSGS
jgi:hypothetical protein